MRSRCAVHEAPADIIAIAISYTAVMAIAACGRLDDKLETVRADLATQGAEGTRNRNAGRLSLTDESCVRRGRSTRTTFGPMTSPRIGTTGCRLAYKF